ncbi:MAG: esterase-like activity of phytase family protein [Hyphomicrobiaceae bacterium]
MQNTNPDNARPSKYMPSKLMVVGTRVGAFLMVGMLTAIGVGDALAKPNPRKLKPQSIKIEYSPLVGFDKVRSDVTHFGELEWIGGGVLTSKSKYFGGWSGLTISNGGQSFVAISDAGLWLTAKLNYRDGRPDAVTSARIGPLKALNGKSLRRNRYRDAEAVTLASGTLQRGQLMIAFEQLHRIGIFPIGPKGVLAPKRYVKLPKKIRNSVRGMKGFEAITKLKGRHRGALLAIAERLPDRNGNLRGWLWHSGKPRSFKLKNIDGYDITDVAALEDGGVILLERRFRWLEGLKVRLRYVSAKALRPDTLIAGKVLMAANLTKEIDNLEGLAVHKGPNGGTILTLLSDDNFNSLLQRTLLLQFLWQRPSDKAVRN